MFSRQGRIWSFHAELWSFVADGKKNIPRIIAQVHTHGIPYSDFLDVLVEVAFVVFGNSLMCQKA